MFYRILNARKKSAIGIEAKVKYDDIDEFFKPNILKKENKFSPYQGTKFFDLIAYCDPVNIAISEKLKNILEQNNITGWSYYPIEIEGTDLRYYGFQMLGKAGPVTNLDEDGFVPIDDIEFDVKTWDGSDIFNLEDAGGIKVCTPRVKEVLEKAKITNIGFEPL